MNRNVFEREKGYREISRSDDRTSGYQSIRRKIGCVVISPEIFLEEVKV